VLCQLVPRSAIRPCQIVPASSSTKADLQDRAAVRPLRRPPSIPAKDVAYPSERMLEADEEPRRPVVSGERPGLSTLHAGTHRWAISLIARVWLFFG
jgi:hypothetical protein